ncbi:MAG: RNA polymerase sigma factor [Telluria sp.]
MNGAALERVFKSASGRIIAALAAQFRNLSLAEDAFSESCARALTAWPESGVPSEPAAWLYRVAERIVFDVLRKERVAAACPVDEPELAPSPESILSDDRYAIPDDRLRLIFICCHPAIAADARVALTLRLVCGLTVTEIARAFLVSEATLARRLTRAKNKIAESGISFELPAAKYWSERLDAVLSTLELAYSKAHEDGSSLGEHRGFASEVLHLTSVLVGLLPDCGDAYALAALIRYAEARRPARVDGEGCMVPLSEQNPALWRTDLIAEANDLLTEAEKRPPVSCQLLQAALQQIWCARPSLAWPAPWPAVLSGYDALLQTRDDPIVRVNRLVALAELEGAAIALRELEQLPAAALNDFLPYHAVRAELLARIGRTGEATAAYRKVLSLAPFPSERRWIERKLEQLTTTSDNAATRDGSEP